MASVIQPVGGITVIVILLDNDDDGLGQCTMMFMLGSLKSV